MASARPTAAAADWRSPDSMTRCSPSAASARVTASAWGRKPSIKAKAPITRPAPPSHDTVCASPKPGSRLMTCSSTPSEMPALRMNSAEPKRALTPLMVPLTPRPGTTSMASAGSAVTSRSMAASRTASPSGWLAPSDRDSASFRASSGPTPGAEIAARRGLPSVKVPVLSKAIVSMPAASPSAPASRTRMPDFEAAPMPVTSASGVARPSAQGQEITSTEMPATTAISLLPIHHQTRAVSAAMAITAGTKMRATRSASCCSGARDNCAVSTMRAMRERVESSPTALASTVSIVDPLSAPAITFDPGLLVSRWLSPVTRLSSISPMPSVTVPSATARWPGLTAKLSPGLRLADGCSDQTPLRRTRIEVA